MFVYKQRSNRVVLFFCSALPARIKAKGNSAKRKIVIVDDTKAKVKKYVELGEEPEFDVGPKGGKIIQ